MPVHFHCPNCQQRLSIARRKIGTTINCPRCFIPAMVPKESDAEEGLRSRSGREVEELVVFDDVPEVLQQQPQPQAWSAAGAGPTSPAPAATAVSSYPSAGAVMNTAPIQQAAWSAPAAAYPPSPAAMTPQGMSAPAMNAPNWSNPIGGVISPAKVSIHPELIMSYIFLHRGAIVAQGAVLVVIAVLGFGLGYLVGNQQGLRQQPHAGSVARSGLKTVVLRGTVAVHTTPQTREPDVGAVLIALPTAHPKKLTLGGWKGPGEGGSAPDTVLTEIQAAGGDIATVNEGGGFELVVPESGEFKLLIISAKARRPTGTLVSKQQLDEMVEWLEQPATLIGWQLYHWGPQNIDANSPPLDYLFTPMP